MINRKAVITETRPPQLITALRTGFDMVANNIGLILFPIVLDLFLWLGPHFSMKSLILPVAQHISDLPGLNTPDMTSLVQSTTQLWTEIANRLNLAGALRTYPVGIPSLMADQFPLNTPWGNAPIQEVNSFTGAIGLWLVFLVIGLVGGSLYFNAVAHKVTPQREPQPIGQIGWVAAQTLFLTIIWVAILLMISIPVLILLTILAMVSPAVAQIAVFLISLFLIWILVPLLFSPHGIFLYRQNALFSVLTSARLVRFILPGTGLFFLSVIILSQGLDLLWLVPAPDSWISLVGVLGHAFIATSTLAASFVYYRDAVLWVQELAQKAAANNTTLKKA